MNPRRQGSIVPCRMRLPQFQLAALLSVCAPLAVPAQVRITEFMASNTQTLFDEDGAPSDWIEIQNASATNVSLLNWALSDSAGDAAKWLFPATNLAAAEDGSLDPLELEGRVFAHDYLLLTGRSRRAA